ncbi:MAG: Fur family transcriptional regulator [Acidimicrobiales bacterium]
MTSTRNTAQRREVIESLARVTGFVSAQDLHGLIVKNGGQIALATVYTQLKRLVESGDVDVVMTDRGESLYRRCVVDAHHHHLACRICGAIVEVDTPELEDWTNAIAERFGYRDLRHVLELSGICAQCQTNAR